MKLQEQYSEIGEGWSHVLNTLDTVISELYSIPMFKGIESMERHNGMLKVRFCPTLHEPTQFIQDSVAYRIERLTAKICETCGQYGLRRTELPTVQTLCTKCYALKYSEVMETLKGE